MAKEPRSLRVRESLRQIETIQKDWEPHPGYVVRDSRNRGQLAKHLVDKKTAGNQIKLTNNAILLPNSQITTNWKSLDNTKLLHIQNYRLCENHILRTQW